MWMYYTGAAVARFTFALFNESFAAKGMSTVDVTMALIVNTFTPVVSVGV